MLPFVGYADSTGELRATYDKLLEHFPATTTAYRPPHGGVSGIFVAHSLDPRLMLCAFDFAVSVNRTGPLSWADRELVNVVTSRLNQCLY